jgi:hypothetical protein
VAALGEKRRLHAFELLAMLGAGVLLVALLAPVQWFVERSTGGLTGQGTGEPPQGLTAWAAFGPWIVPVALAAAVPPVDLTLRRAGWRLAPTVGLLVVVAGLAVLSVGVVAELTYARPACCDATYTVPSARAGLFLAAVAAPLLLLGTLLDWRRRGPGSPPKATAGSRPSDGRVRAG